MPALWKKFYEIEKLNLQKGQYSSGEVFATTASLADKYSISYVTAHRVLRELAQDGLVKNVNRVGSVVLERKSSNQIYFLMPGRTLSSELTTNLSLNMQGIFEEAIRQNLKIKQVTLENIFVNPPQEPCVMIYCYDTTRPGSDIMLQILPENIFPISVGAPCPLSRGGAIGGDYRQMMYNLTNQFIATGYKKIGYLGSAEKIWHLPRFLGYFDALRDAKIEFVYDMAYTLQLNEISDVMVRNIIDWIERKQIDAICVPGLGYAEMLYQRLPEKIIQTVPIGYIGWSSEICDKAIWVQPDYLKQGNESVKLSQEINLKDFPAPSYRTAPGNLFVDNLRAFNC